MNHRIHMLAAAAGFLLGSAPAFADAFADYRAEVGRRVPAGWACGGIRTIEGRTLFDVSSPKNRFGVVVSRCDLISQQEWNLRAARMRRAIDSFIAGKEPAEMGDVLKGMDLPDGRFGKTAVSVSLSEPEIHYPGIGADDQEARKVVGILLGMLKPYDKSAAVAAPAAVPPSDKAPVKAPPPAPAAAKGSPHPE